MIIINLPVGKKTPTNKKTTYRSDRSEVSPGQRSLDGY